MRYLMIAAGAFLATCSLPAFAQQRLTTMTATQVWSVDGSESGEPFGTPLDLVVLHDGTLWLLDSKDQVIRRYTSSGKPLAPVGRRGSGPGEMGNANGLVIAPGGMVWVNDVGNGRINVYRADGTFDHQIARNQGGSYSWRWNARFDEKTGQLVEPAIGRGKGWRRIDSNGRERDSVPSPSCPSGRTAPGGINARTGRTGAYLSYPFSSGGEIVQTGDGHAWCVSTWGTHAALMQLGAKDTLAVTQVEVRNIPVSREEMNREVERIEKTIAKYTTNDFDKSKIPTSKPGIAALFLDADKRLWVQHTGSASSSHTIFDVHDMRGVHVARVTVPNRVPDGGQIAARGNILWSIVLDEDDVPHVAQFRLR